ncbi:MAG: hypothetical protein ACE149_19615 [Armatimonadota bacterium]
MKLGITYLSPPNLPLNVHAVRALRPDFLRIPVESMEEFERRLDEARSLHVPVRWIPPAKWTPRGKARIAMLGAWFENGNRCGHRVGDTWLGTNVLTVTGITSRRRALRLVEHPMSVVVTLPLGLRLTWRQQIAASLQTRRHRGAWSWVKTLEPWLRDLWMPRIWETWLAAGAHDLCFDAHVETAGDGDPIALSGGCRPIVSGWRNVRMMANERKTS